MADSPRAQAVDPVEDSETTQRSYDEFYFEHYSPRPYRRDEYWVTLLGGIAQRIVETIHPALVLDAGCALGILVEVLRQRGVDAQGIDLSSYAIAHVHESVRPYCRVGSITDELPTRYDLIVSIEVLEHLPAAAGAAAIANFCRHTDDVLFSSTPQHYRDATRLNVQPAEYWAELFAEHGLYRDVEFDASFISPWAARYRRSRDGFPRIVRQYERGYAQLSLERNELRSFAYEVQLELARSIEQMPSLQHELTLVRLQRDAEQAANVEARIALVNAARELAAARVTLDTERRRLNSEAERELVDVRAAMDELYGQLNQRILDSETIRNDLAQARATIHNMERSFFWRVRKWLRRS